MANLKRSAIELVTKYDEVNDEIETQVYFTPSFIKLSVVYEAIDLSERTEKNEEKKSEKEIFNEMADFVANSIYNGKFTTEELINGLHAPQAVETLQEQIFFVARGEQSNETKKLLKKKN